MKIFRPIDVRLDHLLLDPNNPRLVLSLDQGATVADCDIEKMQDEVLNRFSLESSPNSSKIDNYDLSESMRRLGYIGIDKIVVRSIDGSSKYVVVEGNRRVSTMKQLVKEYVAKGERPPLTAEKIATFQSLQVMQLKTDDLSEDEVNDRISVILGLRHHGSLLEWEPLPKAHNIYLHYMELQGENNKFEWNREIGREVASILSIKLTEVQKSLRTYIAYQQLCDQSEINTRYYSLISEAITNRKLKAFDYFETSEKSFRLNDDSFERLYNICQFENRDALESAQTIIPKPQSFSQLGQIVEKVYRAKQQTVRVLAGALLSDVESGELDEEREMSLKKTVESAWLELIAFEEGIEWVHSLNELLKLREEKKLNFGDYFTSGNDKRAKDQLASLLLRFQAILGMPMV